MTSDNSIRTCDICEYSRFVDTLDGTSILVCENTPDPDDPMAEVLGDSTCDDFVVFGGGVIKDVN